MGQRYGYIVVQPNANPAPPAASWNPAVDDDKIFDFMQRVAAAWDVDADRWHFTGFSQGGYMSWRFACDHADVLASVAPGAACGEDAIYPDCQFTPERAPSEPLDIIYLHGTQDALVGIACAQPASTRWSSTSAWAQPRRSRAATATAGSATAATRWCSSTSSTTTGTLELHPRPLLPRQHRSRRRTGAAVLVRVRGRARVRLGRGRDAVLPRSPALSGRRRGHCGQPMRAVSIATSSIHSSLASVCW
ncbi:MAG: hypothetical protein U0168_18180 [Nannocystaceae bacterium]